MKMIDAQTSCFLYFSDKKNERAKDMHLLKRLTALLKISDVDPGKKKL